MDVASLPGMLRRIRRTADMSQREFARACGVSQSLIAHAESARGGLSADLLSRAASIAGLRLALLDAGGCEVEPMSAEAVRDRGRRHFPAHLDTRYSEEDWWHGPERYSRPERWYTFDRRRQVRDAFRRRDGTPDDHQLPRPGDSPEDRRAVRRLAAAQRWADEVARRLREGTMPPIEAWLCECPPSCAELEDWQGPPKHHDACRCYCDPC